MLLVGNYEPIKFQNKILQNLGSITYVFVMRSSKAILVQVFFLNLLHVDKKSRSNKKCYELGNDQSSYNYEPQRAAQVSVASNPY